ncbi:hypothetical protein [Halomonas denitrificans]|uniref:hypothetical protein n=1 Tax=Halomonas denitrificans TaxID=370769 RepID=UPI001C9A0350|nr:hypothetical protein [Halomonas denitrificans]MBY5970507.1 hypothetical protein [Halomonas denitrificans]
MAYLLVMGSVLLSIGVCLGWMCWSLGRWLLAGILPERTPAAKKPTPKARSKRAPASRAKKAGSDKAAAAKATTSAPKTPRPKREPTPPWSLTKALARVRSALPLGLLMALVFGVVRLAEKGMAERAEDVPQGYHQLVSTLGGLTLVMLALALICAFCRLRIRRHKKRA